MSKPVIPFDIIDVSSATPEKPEQMGSKEKFWFSRGNDEPWLFKFSRLDCGEDWAEKVAVEVAAAIGVPHAQVEMAVCDGRWGTITRSFVTGGFELVHGNELLANVIDAYPRNEVRTTHHRLEDVLATLDGLKVGRPSALAGMPGVVTGADALVGYLMLDALIGNTDRHHENWAVLRPAEVEKEAIEHLTLAPSYDHASSLGRNEPPARMAERLVTRDERFSVAHYAGRAVSKLHAGDGAPLSTLDAFAQAAAQQRTAAREWLARLAAVDASQLEAIPLRIPANRLAPPGPTFVAALLRFNREQLLNCLRKP